MRWLLLLWPTLLLYSIVARRRAQPQIYYDNEGRPFVVDRQGTARYLPQTVEDVPDGRRRKLY